MICVIIEKKPVLKETIVKIVA